MKERTIKNSFSVNENQNNCEKENKGKIIVTF